MMRAYPQGLAPLSALAWESEAVLVLAPMSALAWEQTVLWQFGIDHEGKRVELTLLDRQPLSLLIRT